MSLTISHQLLWDTLYVFLAIKYAVNINIQLLIVLGTDVYLHCTILWSDLFKMTTTFDR
jgi:hypothetical protein